MVSPVAVLELAAGDVVRWPDGSVAGRVREATRIEEPRAPGEGTCAYVSVGDKSQDIVLCFDSTP